MAFLHQLRRFVLLIDEQPKRTAGSLELPSVIMTDRLDYVVAAVGSSEPDPGFGVGDTVLVDDPTAGRRVTLDGVRYRLVKASSVVGVVESC